MLIMITNIEPSSDHQICWYDKYQNRCTAIQKKEFPVLKLNLSQFRFEIDYTDYQTNLLEL